MTQGIERVRLNAQQTFNNITGPVTERAVYALLSQGAAMAATMTPIDTSTLINSQYAPQIRQSAGSTTGHVGYTAEYAGWVHDAPGTLQGLPRMNGNGNYWDPNAEPGFLEKGMEAIMPNGMAVLRRHYRV